MSFKKYNDNSIFSVPLMQRQGKYNKNKTLLRIKRPHPLVFALALGLQYL
jgi:hypothetical protein